MTAFKNGRAALAVTAGLVGALSLGSAAIAAAPVAAYAEHTVEFQGWNNLSTAKDGTVYAPDGKTALTLRNSGSIVLSPEAVAKNNTSFSIQSFTYYSSNSNDPTDVPADKLDFDVFTYTDVDGNGKYDAGTDNLNTAKDYSYAWQQGENVENGRYVLVVYPKTDATTAVSGPIAWDKADKSKAAYISFQVAQAPKMRLEVKYTGPNEYTGLDQSEYVSVTAWKDGASPVVELKKGEDYDYYFVNEDTNQVVDKIVDAGTYRVVVSSSKYVLANPSEQTFTVRKLDLRGDAFAAATKWSFKSNSTKPGVYAGLGFVRAKANFAPNTNDLAYTGSVIEPSYQFAAKCAYKAADTDGDGKADAWVLDADKTTWVDLDPADYKAYYSREGKAVDLKGKGDYAVSLVHQGNSDIKGETLSLAVTVSGERTYTDVDANAWYSDAVTKARDLKYMTGIAGTNTFDPEGSLTRGQAVQVLYNMAGGREQNDDFFHSSQEGFASYDDVASGAWYAEAVAWAKAYGVVNGYPDGTFRAEQAVSREEFAQMLRNYAAKTQQGTDASADLSSYTDASQLGWSKDAVSWAVANKVMGQGVDWLQPGRTISRAEVAKMVTSFQPDGKLTSSIDR